MKNIYAVQNFAFVALLLTCLFARAEQTEQQPQLIPANPQAGFEYPYYLLIPNTLADLNQHYLIVETNNSGAQENLNDHIEITRSAVLGQGPGPMIASDLNLPLLMPVFPRSTQQSLVYTHALDRDTMLINDDKRQRLDLQLLRMLEDARKQLRSQKILIENKFVLVGFSASGTFSNRFAFLHPSSLLAVVSGAVNAFPMLPIAAIDETKLNYPLGIADIKEISGHEFDRSSWRSLPQMIFMGAVDDNDTFDFDDSFSKGEREIVFEHVGKDMAKRWNKSQAIYLDQTANTTLITYGQIGHWTNGRIRNDMVNFVRSSINKDIRESQK